MSVIESLFLNLQPHKFCLKVCFLCLILYQLILHDQCSIHFSMIYVCTWLSAGQCITVRLTWRFSVITIYCNQQFRYTILNARIYFVCLHGLTCSVDFLCYFRTDLLLRLRCMEMLSVIKVMREFYHQPGKGIFLTYFKCKLEIFILSGSSLLSSNVSNPWAPWLLQASTHTNTHTQASFPVTYIFVISQLCSPLLRTWPLLDL